MNGDVILRTTLGNEEMLLPLEGGFRNIPRIGERLDIGDIFGPCATVTMVTHYKAGSSFYYPGAVMRREGIQCSWGVNAHFETVIDVELDDDHYEPHDADTWHGQMGWDFAKWLDTDRPDHESRNCDL